jgi:hypothetical protein
LRENNVVACGTVFRTSQRLKITVSVVRFRAWLPFLNEIGSYAAPWRTLAWQEFG